MSGIVLIGLMGAGKTTIGQLLAKRTQIKLIDLDQKIVADAQQTIPEIFNTKGEAGFRQLETKALQTCLQQDIVLATGGGIVTQATNRQLLKQSSLPVIYLQAEPELLYQRVHRDVNRPIAHQLDLAGFQALAAQRMPLYQEISDLMISTTAVTPEMIITQILETYSL